jgi:N-acetylmuramoyl-L-alanine amidase
MDRLNYSDIAYNFLVGGDGQVYEGRGWDIQDALAKNVNDISLGIAFIGMYFHLEGIKL